MTLINFCRQENALSVNQDLCLEPFTLFPLHFLITTSVPLRCPLSERLARGPALGGSFCRGSFPFAKRYDKNKVSWQNVSEVLIFSEMNDACSLQIDCYLGISWSTEAFVRKLTCCVQLPGRLHAFGTRAAVCVGGRADSPHPSFTPGFSILWSMLIPNTQEECTTSVCWTRHTTFERQLLSLGRYLFGWKIYLDITPTNNFPTGTRLCILTAPPCFWPLQKARMGETRIQISSGGTEAKLVQGCGW